MGAGAPTLQPAEDLVRQSNAHHEQPHKFVCLAQRSRGVASKVTAMGMKALN